MSDNVRPFPRSAAPNPKQKGYPEHIEAERALLGALLQDPAGVAGRIRSLQAEAFARPDHAELYRFVLGRLDAGGVIDLVTLPRELGASADKMGGVLYILELPDYAPTTANAEHYALVIQRAALHRAYLRALEQAQQTYDPSADPADLVSSLQGRLDALRVDLAASVTGQPDELALPEYDETPWPWFPGVTGMRRFGLYIIAARPGVGKTTAAVNLVHQMVPRHEPWDVLWVATEEAAPIVRARFAAVAMPPTRPWFDFLQVGASVGVSSNGQPMRGACTPEDWQALRDTYRHEWQDPNGRRLIVEAQEQMPGAQIEAAIERAASGQRLAMVVVDYAQNIGTSERKEDLDAAILRIKRASERLRVPVLLLAQVNRAGAEIAKRSKVTRDRGTPPRLLHFLKGTGKLEQAAVGAICLSPGRDERGPFVVAALEKNRFGATGSTVLLFDRLTSRLELDAADTTS